jgi:hypothetical protein
MSRRWCPVGCPLAARTERCLARIHAGMSRASATTFAPTRWAL